MLVIVMFGGGEGVLVSVSVCGSEHGVQFCLAVGICGGTQVVVVGWLIV